MSFTKSSNRYAGVQLWGWGSVCRIQAGRPLVWGLPSWLPFLLSVWLPFRSPNLVHQGPPQVFYLGSFDVVRSLFELTRLPAQSQKCEPDVFLSVVQILQRSCQSLRNKKMLAISFRKTNIPFYIDSQRNKKQVNIFFLTCVFK